MLHFFFPSFSLNLREALLMQNLLPVGCGPSSNTWPRWARHFEQLASVRAMPRVKSERSVTVRESEAEVKLGQPEPDSNLVEEEKSGEWQQTQWYIPVN
jgi:hypothetical protein